MEQQKGKTLLEEKLSLVVQSGFTVRFDKGYNKDWPCDCMVVFNDGKTASMAVGADFEQALDSVMEELVLVRAHGTELFEEQLRQVREKLMQSCQVDAVSDASRTAPTVRTGSQLGTPTQRGDIVCHP